MKNIQKIPVVRVLYRYINEMTRPAPLDEFPDYNAYWQSRLDDGRRAQVLDRHRIIAGLLPEGASVLDIGCGDGAFLRYLKSKRPDCRLTGADISHVAVAELEKLQLDARLIDPQSDLAPQLKGSWDAVVLMEVIEHVVDAEALVRQVVALKPRRIFITIPNAGFMLHRLRLMFGGRFPITSIFYHMKEHVRFWTVRDFYDWASVNRLAVLSHHGQVDRPDRVVRFLGRRMPSLFADRMVYELTPLDGGPPGEAQDRHFARTD